MRNVDRLLGEYGESHQNALNETIHWVCVPAIFFSIVGLISCIPPGPMLTLEPWLGNCANWALPALVVLAIYYVILSPSLAVGMVLFSAGCLALAGFISAHSPVPLWAVCTGVFGISWVFQFLGHQVEGKKPSFLKDLQFLLIGPAWLMHFIYQKVGVSY
ncbi:MAG: Mpo1-like protein [Verrucomicrobiota bacterium]